MSSPALIARVDDIQRALERTLEREQATSDQGTSALANALLTALVKARKDPRITAHVSEQMRRLAAKIYELAGSPSDTADRILAESDKVH
jgi:hypothetical protein